MSDVARPQRSIGRSTLLTLPILLWTALMFMPTVRRPGTAAKIAVALTLVLIVAMFFQMMRTRETYRWRRIFFVALGFLFPIGFVWELIAVRGSMSIPIERMVSGDTPFCFMVIPMIIVPAALAKTIIFPGTLLPTSSNGASIATMIAIWLAATVTLGKGWCAYGCIFGGIEEGFAAVARKARIREIDARWRMVPWAVLAAIVLLSAATFEPTYCMWLCPFKTVTEYLEVRTVQTAIQAGIFLSLFFGLVVAMPVLTKKRTQCAYFCPFGAFQSIFNKTSVFDIRVDRTQCANCVSLQPRVPDRGHRPGVDRRRRHAAGLHEVRRLRGRVPQGCRALAHQRDRGERVRGDRAASLPVCGMGLRGDVRRQHYRRLARKTGGDHCAMRRLLPVLGYTAAALTIMVAAATPFVLLGTFTKGVASSGLRIDPVYSGGDVLRTIDRGAYRLTIYRRVGRRAPLSATGPFVQLKWTPASALPPHVSEVVDLDGDGTPDVRAEFDFHTNSKQDLRMDVTALSPLVRSAAGVGRDSFSSMIARVNEAVVVRVPVEPR